jgi:hypothetical protein
MDAKWRQYSWLKMRWLEQNPNCTSMEYDAACKRFLEQLGL